MTTTLAIIQARMGSTRLPGKVLADVGGQPLLGVMLQRLRSLAVTKLIVATSTASADDAIAVFCQAAGVATVRGPEQDVLGRFRTALDMYPADTVVRLTADCPLADRAVIEEAIALHESTGADYTSNTLVRTYPDGLDVEVVGASVLASADAESADPTEREHVTPFVYRRPDRFRLRALRCPLRYGDQRWTVDTETDLAFVRNVVAKVDNWADAGWHEILAAVGPTTSGPRPGLVRLRPAERVDRDVILEWRNDPTTVEFSQSARTVSAAEHRAWFGRRLVDPSGRIWMAEVDNQVVGLVRVDVNDGDGVVSMVVGAYWRGRGYGKQILGQLAAALANDCQICHLRAVVHQSNTPSLRAFAAAGYSAGGGDGDFILLDRAI